MTPHVPPSPSADPITLFDAAVDALNRADWHAAAALCDPASLAAFRRQLLAQVEPAEPPREVTVEEYLRHMPDMSREVAEYHVAQHRTLSDPVRLLRQEVPGVASIEALRALSDVEVFAAWLDGRSPHRQMERLAEQGRITRAAMARLRENALPMYHYVAVGAVADSERITHVVYRRALSPPETWSGEAAARFARLSAEEQEMARDLAGRRRPQVTTCRRQPDGTWRLLAEHGFLGVGSSSMLGVWEPADGGASGEATGADGAA